MVTMYILKFMASSGWWLYTFWGLMRLLDGDYVHLEFLGGLWVVTLCIWRFKASSGWWLCMPGRLSPLQTLRVRTHCFRSPIRPTMPFCPRVCCMTAPTNVLSPNATPFFPLIRAKSNSRAFKLPYNSSWTWCSASPLHSTQYTTPQCQYNVSYGTTAFVNMEVTLRVSGKYRFLTGCITSTKIQHQELLKRRNRKNTSEIWNYGEFCEWRLVSCWICLE